MLRIYGNIKNYVLSRLFVIGFIVIGIFMPSLLTFAGDPVQEVVNLISVDSYTHYLNERLYAHDGDDRMYGVAHDLARDNIFADFSSLGLEVTLDPFTYNGKTYYNVVAVHEGKVRPSEIYILGGHFDSVGNPGADDNGSGVAGVLEAARVLSQLDFEATIIFIAFDREEQWMVGSYAYANAHHNDDIRGMISADMIAYNPDNVNKARLYGRSASNPLKNALADAFAQYVPEVTAVVDGHTYSDQTPFEDLGFQGCLLIEHETWTNPYYHKTQDSVDTPGYIDYVFATGMTRGAAAWLAVEAGLMDPVLAHPEPGDAGVVNTIRVSGASSGLKSFIVYGFAEGRASVPGCPGLYVEIRRPAIAAADFADDQGDVVIQKVVPAGAKGKTVLLQAVEPGSCRTSNMVAHKFN